MKIKNIRDRKQGTSSLTVRTTKNEKLEYAQAEFLCSNTESCFLPFSYSTEKDELLFSYDVTDLVQMSTCLKAKLSLSQFHALLAEVVHAVESCENHELNYTNLLFEPDQVFLDPETTKLRFAYIPAKGVNEERADVVAFLRDISSHVTFICEEDRAHAHDLIDFLQRQTVFSLIDFKSFIDRNQLERRRDFDDNVLAEPKKSTRSAQARSSKGFDFLKNQTGSVSAQEHRQGQSLAEQVFSDVSEIPFGPTTTSKAPTPSIVEETSSVPTPEPYAPSPSILTPHDLPTPKSFMLTRTSTGDKNELLPNHTYSIGRSNRCDISVKGNSGISREHALFQVEATGCFLIDQGSTNGCSINGITTPSKTPLEVKRGDTIKLADEKFSVE